MAKRSKKIKITFGIPLYSSRPLVHDHLVGNDGAFNETVKGLINAGNSGINIELRVIPTLANYTEFVVVELLLSLERSERTEEEDDEELVPELEDPDELGELYVFG